MDRGIFLLGFFLENRLGFRSGFSDNNRYARLDDACLFGSNLGQSVAQELYMVEADVGDDTQIRTDDVGAVQTASQADFNDSNVHLFFCKVVESHSGSQFEERWMEWFEETPVLVDKFDNMLLAYGNTVYTDAFTEIHQVRRGVETYLVTG